jgi:putative N-acetylmannosamine-6-phosphate epimerase
VLEAGAYALVVGTAITAPAAIARRFVEALASRQAVPR